MIRLLSDTEARTLLTCQAQWDFRYGGRLAGDALKPLETASLLREGKLWGRAVATYHAALAAAGPAPAVVLADCEGAAREALREDVPRLDGDSDEDYERRVDAYLAVHADDIERTLAMLAHYVATSAPLAIERAEQEFRVPIPSRSGGRSNVYRLQCFIDGVHTDEHGQWIVEYKLRKQLSPFEQIERSRQLRWEAWAWRETYGVEPVGVIVDERLNALPAEVRRNPDGRPSKQQSCTPEAYTAAGGKDDGVLEALRAKSWQARHPLLLSSAEIDEAGEQLRSVARQLHGFESGELYPVRNPSQMNCGMCAFRTICTQPHDRELVDAHYLRVPPKRLKEATPA